MNLPPDVTEHLGPIRTQLQTLSAQSYQTNIDTINELVLIGTYLLSLDVPLQKSKEETLLIMNKYEIRQLPSKGSNYKAIMPLLIQLRFNVLAPYLHKLYQTQSSRQNLDPRDTRIFIVQLTYLLQLFPIALSLAHDDLFCLPRDHETWKKLYKNVKIEVSIQTMEQLDTDEKLKQSALGVGSTFNWLHSICLKKSQLPSMIPSSLATLGCAIYYIFASEERNKQAQDMMTRMNSPLTYKALLITIHPKVSKLIVMGCPKIEFKRKIHIERNGFAITKEFVNEQKRDGNINKLTEKLFSWPGIFPELKSLFVKDHSKVTVRILSNEYIRFFEGNERQAKPETMPTCINFAIKNAKSRKTLPNQFKTHEKVIIYIHGGGFVAQNSKAYQQLTRKLAIDTGVPVFAFDYRKCPQYPYPNALDDCWQAYQWIVFQAKFYINVDPKQIIVMGDSAGGHLVVALTTLCIKLGVRTPDSLVLAYPLLVLDPYYYSPSVLISLEDRMLPTTLIQQMKRYYWSQYELADLETDELISPLITSDEILMKFPPVQIVVGTDDSLHDESWRFAHRLSRLNKEFSIVVYNGMPHAFLMMDKAMLHADQTIRKTIETVKSLLKGDQK